MMKQEGHGGRLFQRGFDLIKSPSLLAGFCPFRSGRLPSINLSVSDTASQAGLGRDLKPNSS